MEGHSIGSTLCGCKSDCKCCCCYCCCVQYDYTFDDVAAKSAAGARLCRLVRARPLVNLLASTGVNSTRGLLLVALVSIVLGKGGSSKQT